MFLNSDIYLAGNKLKFMNGELFMDLKYLTYVHLTGNICIDESFDSKDKVKRLPQVITTNCGFCETENSAEKILCEASRTINKYSHNNFDMIVKGQEKQIAMFEAFINTTVTEKESCQADVISKVSTISRLEVTNEQLEAKNAELRETLQLKWEEIDKLLSQSIKQMEEINEKRSKIDELEKKIKLLNNDF